jgi:hypothetical protein
MKEFEAIILEPDQPVEIEGDITQIKPIQLFVLPRGAIDNTPSYALILLDAFGRKYVAQLTNNMLQSGIKAVTGLPT